MADVRPCDLAVIWEVPRTVAFIVENGFKRVALQFSDEHLSVCPEIAQQLGEALHHAGSDAQVYILADTAYNPLAVDEVAAEHVDADCVVHYGRASLHPLSRLPALFVFGRAPLPVAAAADLVAQCCSTAASGRPPTAAVVLPDQPLVHARAALRQRLEALRVQVAELRVADVPAHVLWPPSPAADAAASELAASRKLHATCSSGCGCPRPEAAPGGHQPPASAAHGPKAASAAGPSTVGGLAWEHPEGVAEEDVLMVWLGPASAESLLHLQLTFNRCRWACVDPDEGTVIHGMPTAVSRMLQRRYFLVEKARDAAIIGILVGTLATAGYLQMIRRLLRLAAAADKRTYTMLMGKPNPAKLANFPEIEVWVMVADPQGMILDCKDYFAPIITPFEAELALRNLPWTGEYRLDFASLLHQPDSVLRSSEEPRFSLLDGSYHEVPSAATESGDSADASALVEQLPRSVVLASADARTKALVKPRSADEYMLTKRSFTGLETPQTGAAPKPVVKAVPGLSGRAASYDQEPVIGNPDRPPAL